MSEDEKYKILNQIHQNVNYLKEFDFTKPALNFISLGIYPEGESSSEAKSKAGFIVRKATEAEAFHALPAIKQMLSNSSAHLQQLKSLQIKDFSTMENRLKFESIYNNAVDLADLCEITAVSERLINAASEYSSLIAAHDEMKAELAKMVIDKDTLHRISSHEAAKAELENIKQEVIHVDQELEEDRKKYSILQGEYNRLVADLRELEFTENNEANGPTNEFANPMTEGAVLTKEQQDNMLVEEVIRNLKEQIAQEEQECIKLQNSLNSSMNGSKMLENMFFILQNIEHSKGGPILEPSDYSQLNKLYLDKLLAVIMLITETCKAHKISDFVYESVLDYESNFWYNSFDEFQMAGNVFTNTPNITTSNSNNATNSNTRYLWSIILKLLTKEMYTDELASQLVSLGAINAASEFQPNKMLYPLFARNIVELKPQNDGKVKVTPTWVTL